MTQTVASVALNLGDVVMRQAVSSMTGRSYTERGMVASIGGHGPQSELSSGRHGLVIEVSVGHYSVDDLRYHEWQRVPVEEQTTFERARRAFVLSYFRQPDPDRNDSVIYEPDALEWQLLMALLPPELQEMTRDGSDVPTVLDLLEAVGTYIDELKARALG